MENVKSNPTVLTKCKLVNKSGLFLYTPPHKQFIVSKKVQQQTKYWISNVYCVPNQKMRATTTL